MSSRRRLHRYQLTVKLPFTLSVHSYNYVCSNPTQFGGYAHSTDPNYCPSQGYGTSNKEDVSYPSFKVTISSGGSTVSPTNFATDNSGHATLIVKSSVAETKTVTISDNSDGYEYGYTTLTFTAPTQTQQLIKHLRLLSCLRLNLPPLQNRLLPKNCNP